MFGQKVFGSQRPTVSIDYCDVHTSLFPEEYEKLPRLVDYDLVLLDYSAFDLAGTVYESQQEIFEKQMLEALSKGTCFCILHYEEDVPAHDQYNREDGYMDKKAIEFCMKRQIGFRWLKMFDIRPYKIERPIMSGLINRNEFKVYIERWGATKNAFKAYGETHFEDVIFSLSGGLALGFAISGKRRKGKLLYLPCQRDFDRPQATVDCLTTLIKSTITYLTRSSIELPPWAETPLFTKEKDLHTETSTLQSRIEELQTSLQPYEIAKVLAFKSEYDFEEAVPQFFTGHLGISTTRDEAFKEDFWILNQKSEKIVIAETKTYVGGLKRGGIYSLYNHRQDRDLDTAFPALLVVNAHLKAGSWKEKTRPIDGEDCKCAAKENILVMRTEDLLFFWNSIVEKRHNKNDLLAMILKQKGWAEVSADGNITLHH